MVSSPQTSLCFRRRNDVFVILLATLTMIFVSNIESQVICRQSQSCQYANLTTTGEYIHCYGYESCKQATIVTSGYYISCAASNSCNQAKKIVMVSSSYSIRCGGLASCANSQLISNELDDVNCYGEQSCANTTIADTSDVYCSGDHSCANSQITVTSQIRAGGTLSLTNSQLYSGDSSVSFNFWGFESGYNASLICGTGHTCYVNCYGNGCGNLNAECNGSESSCTLNINCYYAQYDEINCPSGYTIPSDIEEMPSMVNVTLSTVENSYDVCVLSDFNCQNHQQC